jgi:hypothetical protein
MKNLDEPLSILERAVFGHDAVRGVDGHPIEKGSGALRLNSPEASKPATALPNAAPAQIIKEK